MNYNCIFNFHTRIVLVCDIGLKTRKKLSPKQQFWMTLSAAVRNFPFTILMVSKHRSDSSL